MFQMNLTELILWLVDFWCLKSCSSLILGVINQALGLVSVLLRSLILQLLLFFRLIASLFPLPYRTNLHILVAERIKIITETLYSISPH